LEFESALPNIETCESDFLAVVAGAAGLDETPVQLLFGEAKTGKEFDGMMSENLGIWPTLCSLEAARLLCSQKPKPSRKTKFVSPAPSIPIIIGVSFCGRETSWSRMMFMSALAKSLGNGNTRAP
jgi:hypothetical protein